MLKKLVLCLAVLQFLPTGICTAQTQTMSFAWDYPTGTTNLVDFQAIWWEVTSGDGPPVNVTVAPALRDVTIAGLPAGSRSFKINVIARGSYVVAGQTLIINSGPSNTLCVGPACPPAGTPSQPGNLRMLGT